jgi:thiol reductant ABC exporter CydD subunit
VRRLLVAVGALGLLGAAAVVAQAMLLATVVDRAMLHGAGLGAVTPLLLGLAGAVAVRAGAGGLSEVVAQRGAARTTADLGDRLLRAMVARGPGWLAQERTGELSLTATRGVAALEVYLGRYLPQAVLAGLVPLALLVWLAVQDPLAAGVLLVLAAAVPPAMVFFGRRAAANTARQWRQLSSLSARFLELVQGLPLLRAFGRAERGRAEVAGATDALRATTLGTLRVAFLSALTMELLSGLAVGLVAMVVGLGLLDGRVAFTTALAVLVVSPEVLLPLRRAGAEFHASAEGVTAAARILDLVEPPPAPVAPPPPAAGGPDGAVLTLHGVTVRPPGRGTAVLDGFDLVVRPGEHVALAGPSGSGKSTVLAVILGFTVPESGSVTAAPGATPGADPAAWRRRCSWLPQQPHVFSATLAQNLALGQAVPPGEATLRRALARVGLGPWVDQLPLGLDTALGEGGLSLSAGERQRLGLARAMVRDAPVVLLDEPTAHLDRATVADLRPALVEWLAGRTLVLASHDPDALGLADRVVRLGPPAGAPAGPPGATTVPGARR